MGNMLVVETVYQEIKKRILSGYYLPGVHLTENVLAIELKVSRVTMREALRRLVSDELATQVPNNGIWVKRFSRKDVIEIYTVREPLEALAARLAAEAEEKDLTLLEEICAESAKSLAENSYAAMLHRELNEKFHKSIALITGNTTLIKTLERLNTRLMNYQFMPFLRKDDGGISHRDHLDLLEAIKVGDGERAENIMRRHVKKGLEFTLSCFPLDHY